MGRFKLRDGVWLVGNGLWYLFTGIFEDHIMGQINLWIETTVWYKSMLTYIGNNPWLIPAISTIALGIYIMIRSTKPDTLANIPSPIKSVLPSKWQPQLEFQQSISNVKDDNFHVTAFVDIEVENNTSHTFKIASSNLILLFDHKYAVKHQLYRKIDIDGYDAGLLQHFPIEIKPISAPKENQYVLDYSGVVTVRPKYQHTAPRKAWVCFELIGAQTPAVCHHIEFNANWDAVDVKGKD